MKTEKEISKSNKLIAEFMGKPIPLQAKHGDMNFWKYNSSWDWLMPVISKIQEDVLYIKYINESTNILAERGIIINPKYIETTYSDVIEFIKWYNKNK